MTSTKSERTNAVASSSPDVDTPIPVIIDEAGNEPGAKPKFLRGPGKLVNPGVSEAFARALAATQSANAAPRTTPEGVNQLESGPTCGPGRGNANN